MNARKRSSCCRSLNLNMIFPGEKRTRDSLLPAALVRCLVAVVILYYNSRFMFRELQGVPAGSNADFASAW